MKKSLIMAMAGIAILISACTQQGEATSEATQAEKSEPVKILQLDFRSIARNIEYTASLLAYQEVHLAPASPGRIEDIMVEIGQRVTKGASLVQMDRTQLHQAEIQLKTIEMDFKRLDTLRKTGSIALQQYDQIKSQYDIARSNVAFLEENTRLLAPFNGLISGKYFEPGEMYSGAPLPQTGKAAVLSIVQIDRLKVIVPISEHYFPLLKIGMATTIKSDIYPDKTFTGKIFNIHPTIDVGSRSFNVEIAIDNPGLILRPGMFVRVSFELDQIDAILLPAIAVLKLQGSNERYLFVEENGIARRVSVTIGKRYDDMIEVISPDLKHGDHIVVSGQARLLDGMRLSVQQD